jgi:hypothetical protein
MLPSGSLGHIFPPSVELFPAVRSDACVVNSDSVSSLPSGHRQRFGLDVDESRSQKPRCNRSFTFGPNDIVSRTAKDGIGKENGGDLHAVKSLGEVFHRLVDRAQCAGTGVP